MTAKDELKELFLEVLGKYHESEIHGNLDRVTSTREMDFIAQELDKEVKDLENKFDALLSEV